MVNRREKSHLNMLVRMDSMSANAYMRKPFWGHTLPSAELTCSPDVEMVPGSPAAEHLSGRENQIADEESRVV